MTLNYSYTTEPPSHLAGQLGAFFKDIKLAHSVFALPFAASSLWFLPHLQLDFEQVILLLVAIVSARTYAMGANRLLDWKIDQMNPRTANRAVPAGKLKLSSGRFFTFAAAVIFVACSFYLSPLAGQCSIPVLFALGSYSLMKRVSFFTHWYLGLCLGLSPAAVSVALTGQMTMESIWIGLATAFWTAGFDLIYSLQDMDFDKTKGLHSFPSKFGFSKTLMASRLSFALAIACFVTLGIYAALGPFYYFGVFAIASLLAYQHILVNNPAKAKVNMNAAFFTSNAWVSILFLFALSMDKL